MIPVVEDSYRSIDIIFQVGLYQLAQPHTLAAHIAAIGHTSIEETQQTTVGIFHLTDEIAFVAVCVGVKQFGTCGHIVAAKKTVDNLVAIGRMVERGFEYLAEGFGIHIIAYLNVSERMMSAVVSATCLVVVSGCGCP